MTDPIDHLLTLRDGAAQRAWLAGHPTVLEASLAPGLKARADHLMRSDVQACLKVVALMDVVSDVTGNPRDQALARLAEANVRGIYLGEYHRALVAYDTAATLYAGVGDTLGRAIAQIGRLWPLANLGRTVEALETGAWAAEVLTAHSEWSRLADLLINQGVLHGRLGEDREALAHFDRARAVIMALLEGSNAAAWTRPTLARAELNRSIVLRTLGDFAGALQSSQVARQIYADLGQTLSVAKADESRALTLLLMGRTNEALTHLDKVRGVFEGEGLTRHAVLVDLFVSDCYLLLQRWVEVVETTERIVDVFDGLGVHVEVGQALVNQAIAYAQLGQAAAALHALDQARQRFSREDSPVWTGVADLVSADVLDHQADYAAALTYAQSTEAIFSVRGLATRSAQAHLLVARSLMGLGRSGEAETAVRSALALASDIPWLTYQAETLLGQLGAQSGELAQAELAYQRAVAAVERLGGAMMVEFRADFMRDKETPYQALVDLYLDAGQPETALTMVERSRSRALVALLSDRLDIRIQATDPADAALVADLERLRDERNIAYRRWHDPECGRADEQTQQTLLDIEKAMTKGWHRLLIRNTDYARQASLWQVQVAPVQEELPEDTVLLEYYTTAEQVVVFAVTHAEVKAWRLPMTPVDVDRWLRPLWLNFKTTRDQVVAGQPPTLTAHAQSLLQHLYTQLIAPVATTISAYPRLIIVPHGALHYLPFHALHDGAAYLVQRHAMSYLPASSLLPLLTPHGGPGLKPQGYLNKALRAAPPAPRTHQAMVMGHSHGGRLPYAVAEAWAVGGLLDCPPLIEDEATIAALGGQTAPRSIVHVAAHGDFRADNPLFSGLHLADGQLTTLDLFNLRLDASLVTLSGCETGRSVVGGGDELIGLTRALFYAGAASLLVSQWCVEDRATANLMQTFYRKLMQGHTKADALRQAQMASLADTATAHPYFWASFFMTGDGGLL